MEKISDYKKLQESFWDLRRAKGLSQKDVAARIGISLKQYNDWERGDLMRQLERATNKFHTVQKAIDSDLLL